MFNLAWYQWAGVALICGSLAWQLLKNVKLPKLPSTQQPHYDVGDRIVFERAAESIRALGITKDVKGALEVWRDAIAEKEMPIDEK